MAKILPIRRKAPYNQSINQSDLHVRVSASLVLDERMSMIVSSSDRLSCSMVFIWQQLDHAFYTLTTDGQGSYNICKWFQLADIWWSLHPLHIVYNVFFRSFSAEGAFLSYCHARLPIPDVFCFTPISETGVSSDPRNNFNCVWHFILPPDIKGFSKK